VNRRRLVILPPVAAAENESAPLVPLLEILAVSKMIRVLLEQLQMPEGRSR
jgi:hypothetical protein